jgi:site-specific recombinase XerD
MLHNHIRDFLEYYKASEFRERSVEALSIRLNQFNRFVQSQSIHSVHEITYPHLLQFIADYQQPSPHVKKSRVWALHQFFHFLMLNRIIDKNIALKIPYPKIEKKVPPFLTIDEFKRILNHFAPKADSLMGLRNLLLIMMLGCLGLRTSTIVNLNIENVDLKASRLWIQVKGLFGDRKKQMPLPQVLCILLQEYLQWLHRQQGPLFLSKRNKRISDRTLQDLFRKSADKLGIDKRLHPHLFRHTAATHLNKVAGPEITQCVLGHARRETTRQYTHLNPDLYAEYMKRHPYMEL